MTAHRRGMARCIGTVVLAAAVLAFGLAGRPLAADFTQSKRDAAFLKSCRRQDKEMSRYYGDMIPAGIGFNHQGSFHVRVHRQGLERQLTLVPVATLPFSSIDALTSQASQSAVVVGALVLNYGQFEPLIQPGTNLLIFDGLHVHLKNVHGEVLATFDAELSPLTAGAPLDPVVGTFKGSSAGLANVDQHGGMNLYLQLASGSKALSSASSGFSKLQLRFSIPGIVDDDDSPMRELAQPKDA